MTGVRYPRDSMSSSKYARCLKRSLSHRRTVCKQAALPKYSIHLFKAAARSNRTQHMHSKSDWYTSSYNNFKLTLQFKFKFKSTFKLEALG